MRETYDVERVFNWRLVVHGSEEVVLDRKDDNLLEQFVAHQELFCRPRDISVTMFDSHTGESRLLHLESHQPGQVHANLGFLSWVDTWVCCRSPDIESLIANLVDHF